MDRLLKEQWMYQSQVFVEIFSGSLVDGLACSVRVSSAIQAKVLALETLKCLEAQLDRQVCLETDTFCL